MATQSAVSPDLVVVIDTREQKPYDFPRSVVKTLETGDYSIQGMENLVTIERKSLVDCYSTLGGGRDRFLREFERMGAMQYAAVVIESSLPGFLVPPPRSGVHPRSALGTLIAWSLRYRVHIHFASDRRHGNALVVRILEHFYREQVKRENAGETYVGTSGANPRET